VVVFDRPVIDVEQPSGLGVHSGVPEVDVRGVVDGELPGQAQTVLRGLPSETGRDRLVGDAGAREDALLGWAALPLEYAQVLGLIEFEGVGCSLDCLGGVEIRVVGDPGPQVAHQRAGGEENLAVGRDAHGGVRPKDLELLVALVQVEVGDAAVRALELAGDKYIGDIGARDTELRRTVFHVVECVGGIELLCRCGTQPDRR
jgi:hypothetical protein